MSFGSKFNLEEIMIKHAYYELLNITQLSFKSIAVFGAETNK